MSDRYVVESCPDRTAPFRWLVRDTRKKCIVGLASNRETAESTATGLNVTAALMRALKDHKPAPPKVAE